LRARKVRSRKTQPAERRLAAAHDRMQAAVFSAGRQQCEPAERRLDAAHDRWLAAACNCLLDALIATSDLSKNDKNILTNK